MDRRYKVRCFGSLVGVILFLTPCFFSCGARIVEVPVERVRTEYKTIHTIDTIHTTDSVKLTQSGDTIFVESIRYKERIKTRVDTILKVDTIQVVKVVDAGRRANIFAPFRLLPWVALAVVLFVLFVVKYKRRWI